MVFACKKNLLHIYPKLVIYILNPLVILLQTMLTFSVPWFLEIWAAPWNFCFETEGYTIIRSQPKLDMISKTFYAGGTGG